MFLIYAVNSLVDVDGFILGVLQLTSVLIVTRQSYSIMNNFVSLKRIKLINDALLSGLTSAQPRLLQWNSTKRPRESVT